MTKKDMLNLVAYKFGFDSDITIDFSEAIEWLGNTESEALLMEVLQIPL